MQQRNSRIFKSLLYVMLLVVMVYVVVFMPTPYMVNQPGSAEEIKPMIRVAGGDPEEKGTFMMTTVSVTYANVAALIASQFNSQAQIVRKTPEQGGKEYETQQIYYMSDSQSSAMAAAYHKAKVPFNIVSEYVFVVSLSKSNPPKGDFAPGDIIRKVEGQALTRFEQLSGILKTKKAGDRVSVELERDGKTLSQQAELIPLKDPATGGNRAGFGLNIGELRKVKSVDPKQQVEFAHTQVGGPSAGLMFTLEIYNQLTPGDLSKGYRIAGTGTMSTDGTVGPIGGVQFKIVAADREKAEIFFVPEDNYKDAKKKAEEIGTSMKLVPVKTVDDALNYLSKLKAKAG
ncbi:SepM family pheromone-processing serine protease [Paenibacillus tuaregi]|uniref:SepM family pheromone-processing serine protease n=1 Tax=Paenibacillus tuaregi TaxID=1816681 RepID=UPI000838AEB7|nr:SepM family pheromone-processing serine protease [Paenibacillus tuaregi]